MTTNDIALPGALSLGLARTTIELRTFFRDRSSVVFTFALPVIMLVLLGSVFSGAVAGTGITGSQLFVGGMIAGGVASTSFMKRVYAGATSAAAVRSTASSRSNAKYGSRSSGS